MKQRINLIAAIGKKGQLGLDCKLPWRDARDMAFFQRMTMGGIVIVGGRTAIGMPYLPGRKLLMFHGRHIQPEELLAQTAADGHAEEIWIAGGEYTYRAFAPFVNGLKLFSVVDYEGPADTWFPFDAYGMTGPDEGLTATLREAAALLRAHHKHQCEQGEMGIPDGKGGFFGVDMGGEYGDSTLCERTISMLWKLPEGEVK